MRLPELEYPEVQAFLSQDSYSYLFGRDLLICPVLEKGASSRIVRLPPGQWVDFWTGQEISGERIINVPAPLEIIPVFIKANSPRLPDLLRARG
jgi:alpha-glucosidase